ncbi:MAG: response regulator [Nannocystis sp.]|nr:ATP-binding protein [Nannocystis sp.]MBA3549021.1 response regulator [Nannocystis sp.]
MSVLADLLAARRDGLLELLTQRVQATLASADLTRSELIDHFPAILRDVGQALLDGASPTEQVLATHHAADAHGAQRLRIGFDLNAVVREYGLLRDCIFELLGAAKVVPELHELRIVSDCISAATAHSVIRYVREREDGANAERRHLLDMFEQAPGFVCFLRGRELVFELANAAYFQLAGHREVFGKSVYEALPELKDQGHLDLIERAFVSGRPFVGRGIRVALQREPGAPLSEVFLDLILQPIRDVQGRVSGILLQGHDVSEVKQQEAQRQLAEAAQRASEERYRTLFESIDDGFCLVEILFDESGEAVDYRFIETNAAFAGQSGLVGAVGKTALELVPGLARSWFHRYGVVAATGQSMRFEDHDPALGRWLDVFANRVGAPALRQVAIVFKDISERKRIEKERAHLFRLESAARQAAEEASRLRDEFLTTVSHELRTPLTSILGWARMLRVGTVAAEKRDQALETIERNARAQAQLIDDLLDVSSILAGKLRLEVTTVDVQSIVAAALETVRPAAEAKGIQLRATLAADGTVMGDPHRLQQVAWNLLANAVKFTPAGGRVQVLVERKKSAVEITVTDTGVGIASDFQPHVFERFRQADGAPTRAHGGLGLGLSIVRQLVESHGGTVSVFSEGEGRGASFTVGLPLAVARRPQPSAPAGREQLRAKGLPCPPELDGLHILVVDDESDTRELLRTLLEPHGVHVMLAASAAEGLQLVMAGPPDLLLSGLGMPKEDGYALITKLRQLPAEAGGEVPAVALTARACMEERSHALLAGFNNHISKPVEALELLAVVASLSRRSWKRGG